MDAYEALIYCLGWTAEKRWQWSSGDPRQQAGTAPVRS